MSSASAYHRTRHDRGEPAGAGDPLNSALADLENRSTPELRAEWQPVPDRPTDPAQPRPAAARGRVPAAGTPAGRIEHCHQTAPRCARRATRRKSCLGIRSRRRSQTGDQVGPRMAWPRSRRDRARGGVRVSGAPLCLPEPDRHPDQRNALVRTCFLWTEETAGDSV